MKIKNICFELVFLAILIILDQATKSWASANLDEDLILWQGVLVLHYLENTGAAFSLLTGQMLLFYILTPILCLLILVFYSKIPFFKRFYPLRLVSVALFAGAIGNFIDRVRLKYVVDFIYFSLIDFPVFNVADIYVTVSVALLVILVMFYYKDEELKPLFSLDRKKGHE